MSALTPKNESKEMFEMRKKLHQPSPGIIAMQDKFNEHMYNSDMFNPFARRRRRGRPSLEQLILEDFADCWNEDHIPTFKRTKIGFLGALLDNKTLAFKKGKRGEITLPFIKRGTI